MSTITKWDQVIINQSNNWNAFYSADVNPNRDQEEFLGGSEFQISDFRFQISDFRFHILLYWLLKDRKVSWIIRLAVNQIIWSSSSMAANFRAATRARSDAEFYARKCIVVEECDETLFWLEYLICINLFDADKTKEIYSEVEQHW